ncbi:MAG: rubrerythrin family protein [Candidatus Accumulibacter sp.]|jgi:rubrerythrin|nr:rubrerythrin family protein [Accumulibacter sp.]
MANFKGSKTEGNLKKAFAGESQARGSYVYFAAKAREEGYSNVARVFEEFAVNEQEHAKLWFKELGNLGSTPDNLKAAIAGEEAETTVMYPEFAKIAEEEGFKDIAAKFRQVADIEKTHEVQFRKLLDNLKKDSEFKTDGWKCKNCGHSLNAKSAPPTCPVCGNTDIAWSGYKAFAAV